MSLKDLVCYVFVAVFIIVVTMLTLLVNNVSNVGWFFWRNDRRFCLSDDVLCNKK